MGKTQIGARVDDEIVELARARAKELQVPIGDYLARLVLDDVSGLRERALEAARRFLDEHQGVFDEAEEADHGSAGAHAA
ncbi:hypothetical protein [Streptomyces capparidis]